MGKARPMVEVEYRQRLKGGLRRTRR